MNFTAKYENVSHPVSCISYTYLVDNKEIGIASVMLPLTLPSVGIVGGSEIILHERGKGYGTLAHQQRISHARDHGIDYLLCTVRSDNHHQVAIMRKFGWKELDRFFNNCTCNDVIIYGKDLWKGR